MLVMMVSNGDDDDEEDKDDDAGNDDMCALIPKNGSNFEVAGIPWAY